jgi:hypothetical protein
VHIYHIPMRIVRSSDVIITDLIIIIISGEEYKL